MPAFGTSIPRKVMTLFLLVDCSGSMAASGNIGKVNGAIEEMIPLLRNISDENADAEIRIGVLAFSSGCRWIGGGVQDLDHFQWTDMKASGLTDMGAAFRELENRLSRKEFMDGAAGNYAPVIILLSDGEPTDDYRSGLAVLQHNNWYREAQKIAIAVDKASIQTLSEFTGNIETVLSCNGQKEDLKHLIVNVATVSSKMQSRSQTAGTKVDEKEIADQIRRQQEDKKKQVISELAHMIKERGEASVDGNTAAEIESYLAKVGVPSGNDLEPTYKGLVAHLRSLGGSTGTPAGGANGTAAASASGKTKAKVTDPFADDNDW